MKVYREIEKIFITVLNIDGFKREDEKNLEQKDLKKNLNNLKIFGFLAVPQERLITLQKIIEMYKP